MLTDDCSRLKINNLRLILSCFYVYLLSNTFKYVKQVVFHYPNHLFDFHNYVLFRCLIGLIFQTIYSILILYSLWLKHLASLMLTVFLFTAFLIARLIFDIYGNNYQYSIYFPFEYVIKKDSTKNSKGKILIEEISDLIIELIINTIGILLTIVCIFRMLRKQWKQRKQMEFKMKIIRRKTVC